MEEIIDDQKNYENKEENKDKNSFISFLYLFGLLIFSIGNLYLMLVNRSMSFFLSILLIITYIFMIHKFDGSGSVILIIGLVMSILSLLFVLIVLLSMATLCSGLNPFS